MAKTKRGKKEDQRKKEHGGGKRARVRVPGLPKPVRIKQSCCQSRPRCKNCPLVVARLRRLPEGLGDKALRTAVKAARSS